jgi:hypothetical protein
MGSTVEVEARPPHACADQVGRCPLQRQEGRGMENLTSRPPSVRGALGTFVAIQIENQN